ncbi:hypothetical protein KJ903_04280 [Patescibacteria group bacterium]|nr:hypothetical protein [Patescibacteria group bacterium]
MRRHNGKHSKITAYMGVEVFVVLLVLFIIASCMLGAKVVELMKDQENMVRLDVHVEVIRELEATAARVLKDGDSDIKKEIITLKEYLARLRALSGKVEKSKIMQKLKDLRIRLNRVKELIDQPPIITLAEARGFYFRSGRSEVPAGFEQSLRQSVIPKIAHHVRTYKVDVIEVIGHTDEVPNRGGSSNLDNQLLPFLRGEAVELQAGSNTSLGMARAAAIVRILNSDSRLQGLKIVPLSAGQAINLDGTLASGHGGNSQQRRRIEIRLKRSLSLSE